MKMGWSGWIIYSNWVWMTHVDAPKLISSQRIGRETWHFLWSHQLITQVDFDLSKGRHGLFTLAVIKVLESEEGRGATYEDVVQLIGRLRDLQYLLGWERHPCYGLEMARKNLQPQAAGFSCLYNICMVRLYMGRCKILMNIIRFTATTVKKMAKRTWLMIDDHYRD